MSPRARDLIIEVFGTDVLAMLRALIADPDVNGQRRYMRLATEELADGLVEILTEPAPCRPSQSTNGPVVPAGELVIVPARPKAPTGR